MQNLESIENEAAVANLAAWLLSNGEQGERPEWYEQLKTDQIVADALRCSVFDISRLTTEKYERTLIAVRAEKAVREQKEREGKRLEGPTNAEA